MPLDMTQPPQQGVQFQQAGQYASAFNPAPAAPQEGPPTTPQELEQRKSGWTDFITKLQTDPAMRQAALLTATQMMRGPGMGESNAGAMGRALQTGIIAHGFLQGNQTGQAMDMQKLDMQQNLMDSQTAQNQAQTAGLNQEHGFAQEMQPLKMRQANQQVDAGDFQEANRAALLQDQLDNSASNRKYQGQMGTARVMNANRALQNSGPKTPAGVALFNRQVEALKASNPPFEGEDPHDYQGRIEAKALDYNKRPPGGGNPQAVQVQALNTLIANTDDKDPMMPVYKKQLAAIGGGGTPQAGVSGSGAADKGAFDQANDLAKKAGKSTFNGPDGKTYKVK